MGPRDILVEELGNAEEEVRDFRTRQWESLKYFTTVLTSLLALFGVLLTLSLREPDFKAISAGICVLISLLIIVISLLAIENFQRETYHLFRSIAVVCNLRRAGGLYFTGDCREDGVQGFIPDKWAWKKSKVLAVDLDQREIPPSPPSEGNSLFGEIRIAVSLVKLILRGTYRPTFAWIGLLVFSTFTVMGLALLIVSLYVLHLSLRI